MYENSTKDITLAQQGNEESMSKLVQDNTGLIWSIVKRFGSRGYELEDLYQIGAIGFIKSIKRFDTQFEVKLSTYAVPYILGEIKRFIRDDGPIKVSRSIKELGMKVREVQREYLRRYGVEININKIAEELEVSKEEIALSLDAMNPVDSIYSDSSNDDDGSISILDRISSKEDEAEKISNRLTIKDLIKNLKDEEKEIILLRYYKEKTQTEVAKILGISQVQVSRIEKKVLGLMKVKLTC